VRAEMAFAHSINRYWTGCGKGSLGLYDVGNKYEVRAVPTGSNKGLIVRPYDKDGPYILVDVNDKTRKCDFIGWATKKHIVEFGIKEGEGTDRPYWILPRQKLLPFEDILDLESEHIYKDEQKDNGTDK